MASAGKMQGEAARRAGEPSGDGEEPPPEGLVVTSCSPRPMRAVQRASNCVGCPDEITRLSPAYPMVAGPLANRNCRPLRPWRLSNGSLMSCATRRSWST